MGNKKRKRSKFVCAENYSDVIEIIDATIFLRDRIKEIFNIEGIRKTCFLLSDKIPGSLQS